MVEIGDQYGILVAGQLLAGFAICLDETQELLAGLVLLGDQQLALQRAAQHDHTPGAFPASQPQFAILTLPSLTRVGPVAFPEQALDVAFDVLRQAKLE